MPEDFPENGADYYNGQGEGDVTNKLSDGDVVV